MSRHLREFEFDGINQTVIFQETSIVNPNVRCHVYSFEGDQTKDLGIIEVEPGASTPWQRVEKGNRTVEGYLSGSGRLKIYPHEQAYQPTVYILREGGRFNFRVDVKIGQIMQWEADKDSTLVAYEVCYPPFPETPNRYTDLPEDWETSRFLNF